MCIYLHASSVKSIFKVFYIIFSCIIEAEIQVLNYSNPFFDTLLIG